MAVCGLLRGELSYHLVRTLLRRTLAKRAEGGVGVGGMPFFSSRGGQIR